jgi:hypothetical protein
MDTGQRTHTDWVALAESIVVNRQAIMLEVVHRAASRIPCVCLPMNLSLTLWRWQPNHDRNRIGQEWECYVSENCEDLASCYGIIRTGRNRV